VNFRYRFSDGSCHPNGTWVVIEYMGHSHDDHPHHHEEVAPVERRKFLAGLSIAAGAVAAGTGRAEARVPVNPWGDGERWYRGDHHIHTQYSDDGQYTIEQQIRKAREFGLDWAVITDHGGPAH
jgi:hypothetical protein